MNAGRVHADTAQKRMLVEQASALVCWGAWDCDLATERLTWTDAVYAQFGRPFGSPLRRAEILTLYTDESRQELETARALAVNTGRGFALDICIRPDRHRDRWIRLTAGVSCDAAGRPFRLYGAKQDVTAEREAWSRLRIQAENDPLTGLANRRIFDERLDEAVRRAPDGAALVLVDLDRFKPINDRHGHAAGDAILRESARRLRQSFPADALVARIGGDEFAVLVGRHAGRDWLLRALERASRVLARPITWKGISLDVSASIGARLLGDPPGRPSALFAEADSALYAAKSAGRNTIRLFGTRPAQIVQPARRIARIPVEQFCTVSLRGAD